MPAPTQTREILVKVDTKDNAALRKIASDMGLLNNSTKSLAGNMRNLSTIFHGWIAALGIGELARISDQMQNLENRLKIVTSDGKASADVLMQIRDIARSTYQPISDVAEAYVRMGSALRNVRANSEQLGALTETLINTFRAAGTTTTETVNTMIQLSQSFSSGEVRGQELRSVLEQNAVLAGYLRKEFGKDIMKKAEQGMIRASSIARILYENFDELQAQVKLLTPTFEQSVSIAMTDFSLAVHNANKELGLSVLLYKTLTGVVENAGVIIAGFAVGALSLLIGKLILMKATITGLTAAMVKFLFTNPFGWAILAGSAVATLVYNLGGLRNTLDWLYIGALKVAQAFYEVEKFMTSGRSDKRSIERFKNATNQLIVLEAKINKVRGDIEERNNASNISDEQKRSDFMKENLKQLEESLKAYEGGTKKIATVKSILGELNKALNNGSITIDQYNNKIIDFELFKLDKEFEEGKISLDAYREGLDRLKFENLNRRVREGTVSFEHFNKVVRESKISSIEDSFSRGKMTLVEYHKELSKISEEFLPGSALIVGSASVIESIGSITDQVVKGIGQAFGHLEDNLVEFIKTGEFNFKKFAQSILDDLTRIIIRASIIKPLAEGMLGSGYGSEISTAGGYSRVGGGAVNKFARGGIVDSPTAFKFGRGRLGLMGEKGPEAILPLKRGSDGNLGVASSPQTPVVVNIINKTDTEIKQSERTGPGGEKVLDVFIVRKVREGLASGAFDKQLQSDFGLRRKGS